jgi:hypothetical protein
MGHQVNRLCYFLIAISMLVTACSKDENNAIVFTSKESVNQRFNQSMKWNSNHPFREIGVPSDDYFILATGDCHVGGTNNLDSFFNNAKTMNAAADVIAGDLTMGHVKEYELFKQHVPDQDSLPSFVVVGNHDLHFNGWEEFYTLFGSSTYLFTIKSPVATDLYICLDSGGGTLGLDQIEWLSNILQTSRDNYRHCFVITHNNLFRFRHTDSTNPPVEEIEVLIELFTKYHVEMVITGHDHKQDAVLFGLTTYIVMDGLKDGLSNAGYFQLRVNKGKIEYKFINF